MKHFPIRIGLCAILACAGNVCAQQEPPAKPVVPQKEKLVPTPVRTIATLGEPLPYVQPCPNGICAPLYPQPIFCWSGDDYRDICAIESLVNRTIKLGFVDINTKKLADVLERGFPDGAAKPKGGPAAGHGLLPIFQLASTNAQEVAQAGKDAQPDSKQVTDEINKALKVQADLLRSMDIGALYRPVPLLRPYPSFCPHPWAFPTGAGYTAGSYPWGPYPCGGPMVAGCCGYGYGAYGCALVLTGRTGLELTLMAPQVHDVLTLPRDQGLYVKEVYAKTPADLAGYKKNDILIEFDGKKVPAGFLAAFEQVFSHMKNDTPINAVVLRAGQRVDVNGMKVTDKRMLPPLPHECPIDAVLPELIQVLPGINSALPNTSRLRELRIITRPGGITEFIWVDPTAEKK